MIEKHKQVNSPLWGRGSEVKLSELTPRQEQVTALICRGLSNDDAGLIMNIESGTVKYHLTLIYKKFNLTGDNKRHRLILLRGGRSNPIKEQIHVKHAEEINDPLLSNSGLFR